MIHVVTAGETLWSIAQRYQVPMEQIIWDNQLIYPERLVVGQALLILYPQADGACECPVKTEVTAGGYSCPSVDRKILQEALPHLSELYIFSYGFTPEGNLLPIDDAALLALALEYGIKPVLVLTSFGEKGSFDQMLVTEIIWNPDVREKLIEQLLMAVKQKGYTGVEMDFEYVRPEDRVGYADFVREVRMAMNEEGYTVSVTLPAKTSANQRGLLYEGTDYGLLGEAADRVLLMTYEWGYTYSEPMSVAPLPEIRRVLDYAVAEIAPKKISLGIPNYGYDWQLPYRRGLTRARSVGNVEAVRLAESHNALIRYDEMIQSPCCHYVSESTLHEVWFEDVRSIQAKFDLVKEYGLRGVGYWNLMRPFLANWLLLSQNFYILR